MAIMFLAMIPFVFIMRGVRAPAAAMRPPGALEPEQAEEPALPPKKPAVGERQPALPARTG
ncbi:MAG TPA: hypothetical protein VFK81_20485 [Terriglobales bacterium]|nr:hypothetical protein [Terriglobales bacterium]